MTTEMDERTEGKTGTVDYLRISITDRCNLRCLYCMPREGVEMLSHEEVLSYEEFLLFVQAAHTVGFNRIRITGGEPLVRRGLTGFIEKIAGIDPGMRISLTTNGLLLAQYAPELKRAGLSRVNISIDTLDPDRYREITRVGEVKDALSGLHAAIEEGLTPVKVNVVTLRGINDDPTALGRLSMELPVHVRFIEYMPYFGDPGKWHVPSSETRERLERIGDLREVPAPEGWGPATYFRYDGAPGTIGFISPVSCSFCSACNRLRISSNGIVRTCLFERDGFDVRSEIRAGADVERVAAIIREQLDRKRREGDYKPSPGERIPEIGHMSRIGG